MNRLAKKCIIASSLLHGTLVLVLLVGPAFLTSNPPLSSKDIIDFIPAQIIDANMTGGGNPNVAPAPLQPRPEPPAPVPPTPRPEPRAEVRPEPKPEPKEEVKPEDRNDKPDPDALEATPKNRKPKVDLTRKVTNPAAKANAKAKAEAAAAERAQAAAEAKRRQDTLKGSLSSLRNNTGGKVDIGDVAGPGGGGPSYASFETVLKSIYFNNWREPSDATLEDAVVKATVTIASDGTVLSARVTKTSGDPAVDRSVQRLLEDVTFIAPFPAGAKEKQRTYPLSFSLKAKRGLG